MEEGWLPIMEAAASKVEDVGNKASAVTLCGVAEIRSEVNLSSVGNLTVDLVLKDSQRKSKYIQGVA